MCCHQSLSGIQKAAEDCAKDLECKNEFHKVDVMHVGVQAVEKEIPRRPRELRVSISNASTAASEASPRRASGAGWGRLALSALSRSRVAFLRSLASAPASVNAMLDRHGRAGDDHEQGCADSS